LFNRNIPSTCPHKMVNFGPLTAEIGWSVWVNPANFNRFRIFASLLQRCRSTKVNQTSHDVWSSAGLVHYVYFFRDSCPLTEFCQVQNLICVRIFHSPTLAALLHGTRTPASATLCGMVQRMELRNFHSSPFSTDGAINIPTAAITLGMP